MWLYGSVARREDHVGSDVDIGLIARPDDLAKVVGAVREHLRETSERLFFLPNVVGLDFNDVGRMARDDDPWWKSCVADAFVLLGKHPEDIAQELLRGRRGGQKGPSKKRDETFGS
ncbi:nucleotidyltransferase domain-containing protein [Sinorhizobium meliloti]|nr:nucleotidyltransferase domain-containing protein [Sinorhizobium meliloti]